MSIKYLLSAVVLVLVVSCSQDLPVIPGGYGFNIGDPYGTLHI
jgi:branched-subunit amino acid transport protein AzlD